MKRSKTSSASTKFELKSNIARLVLTVFILTGVLFWRMETVREKDTQGEVSFRATLLDEPKVYYRSQYFDIYGYMVKVASDVKVGYGDRLEITGIVKDGRINDPKVLVVGSSSFHKRIFFIRTLLKDKIYQAFSEPSASFLAGVLLGFKEGLPETLREDLIRSGTIHVVVVSGYNISVVAGFALSLSRFIKRRLAIVLGLITIVFYTILVGAEPPAVRAAIMGGLAFAAVSLGRQRFSAYSLLLTALVMVFLDPPVLTNISFQLSFLATAGIIFFREKLSRLFGVVPKPFGDDLATTIAAQSTVVPVIFYHFGQISAVSPIANAAVLWIIPIVTFLGFGFLGLSLILPAISMLIGWAIWALISVFIFWIKLFAGLPIASFSVPSGNLILVAFYYFLLTFLVIYAKNARLVSAEQE